MFGTQEDEKVSIRVVKKIIADFIQYFNELKKRNPDNISLYSEFITDHLNYLNEPCVKSCEAQEELKVILSEWEKNSIAIPDNDMLEGLVKNIKLIFSAHFEHQKRFRESFPKD